jgi:hypothetical protein
MNSVTQNGARRCARSSGGAQSVIQPKHVTRVDDSVIQHLLERDVHGTKCVIEARDRRAAHFPEAERD